MGAPVSLFRRAEQRAVTSIEGWGRGDDVVLGSSMQASLSVVPVFAACRLISDSISTLPLQAYRKSGEARTPIPLPAVFDKETRIEWVQQAVMSLLLHGNAYGLVVARAGDGTPLTVVWLNPEHVQVDESGPLPVFRYMGRELPSADVKHIPAYSIPGSVVGVSPIGACSLLTDTGAATQKMMRDWFKGRAVPGVTAQNIEKVIPAQEAAAIQERLSAKLRNGQPFVHGKDWVINVMSMPADDAGFIASAKLNATQIATIYGIPPEMIGGETGSSLTYSTVELNTINFATFTLRPWLAKLEQEFSSWIHQPRFVKFNVDAMIRVDTKTRYEVHQIARTIGLNNIDELRAIEDKPSLPDGKGQDYTPLAKSTPAPVKEER
ncbi:MAG: phage portal protein [Solimonas sp.]